MCSRTTHFTLDETILVQRLQSTVCSCRVPLHGSVQLLRVLGLSGRCFPKIVPFSLTPPLNTPFPIRHPKRHLDRFSRFCMGPKCYAAECIVNGEEKKPKISPSPWDFVTLLEEDRSTAIDNICKKWYRIEVSLRRYPGRETDREIRYTDILTTMLTHPLRGFARRWMHSLLYHASGNHRRHCKTFNRISQLWYICRWTTIIFSSSILH